MLGDTAPDGSARVDIEGTLALVRSALQPK